MVLIICLIIGIVSAFVGSLLGLGGGIVFIPTMLFLADQLPSFSWAKPQTIVGLSLIAMVITALSSTISYAKKDRVDFKTGAVLLFGSIPGGIFGSWINQFVNVDQFTLYFGILVIGLSLLLFIKREPRDIANKIVEDKNVRRFVVDGKEYEYVISIPVAFIISIIVGIVSGL